MYLLKNCRLIAELTEGYSEEFGDILVEEKRIKAIGKNILVDESIEQIDMKQQTVMPGIIDLHVHLLLKPTNYCDLLVNTPGESIFSTYGYAKMLLKSGVTTVRDVGGDGYYGNIAVRDAIDQGLVEGPRIISCGRIITPTECGNDYFKTLYVETDGTEDMRKAVRYEFKQGAQFIKLTGSGSMLNPSGKPGERIIEEDEMLEATRLAQQKGKYVVIHAHGAEAIRKAFECGVKTVEHASLIDDETVQRIKGRKDIGIVPTLFINDDLLFNTQKGDSHEFVLEKLGADFIENIRTSLRHAINEGVQVGWGTDVVQSLYEKNPGKEFLLRKQFLEIDNIQILLQATKNSAELLDMGEEIGTIKVGKMADLIVVQGKPDEDLAVMNQRPMYVFKEGRKIII